jgi:subtilisin-like proprotein convertase family protein
MKRSFWIALCLLPLLVAWLLWPSGGQPTAVKPSAAVALSPTSAVTSVAAAHQFSVPAQAAGYSAASTNREFFRLTNTSKTIGELANTPHAILLENALIDTAAKLDLKIPAQLRATGEPGAYIVQARGLVDAPFRALLAGVGAQVISYIPNNAYLVQLSAGGAAALAANAQMQAVLPFEPYYKIQASLLGLAVEQKPLPPAQVLTLGLYAAGADDTVAQIEKMGGAILATDRSPFGPVVRVRPPADWIALAQLPGVQRVEPATRRKVANDLARVALGISTNTVTGVNWLGLNGKNVLVEVNDTGIDPGHPDFTAAGTAAGGPSGATRVTGDSATSLYDTSGHGTHVAGVIAGNGSKSLSPVNVGSVARGSVTNADFRGKAPLAKLFSVGFLGANDTNEPYISDKYLQEMPALTNALISNNSWDNGANEYDLEAASYDAAVRDAVPEMTGPQPVLFVFAAGNDGNGADSGSGGYADTITSPGTAKNVVTVGALEQYRLITNVVTGLDGSSNAVWEGETDSGTQVAWYSSRGNVGVGTEGTYGRFKPDVVAPGTFVVSTRPSMWDQVAYYSPTNYDDSNSSYGLVATTNALAIGGAGNVPLNAVAVTIKVEPNSLSPVPFPTNMPIYISATTVPTATSYDFATSNNVMSIPPGGGTLTSIASLYNGFNIGVGDGTNIPVNFDLIIQITTTNDLGNQLTVLSNLNSTLGPYYYYESGTSIAAPAISGTLALIQDFFVNQKNPANATNPSPALLKAMLINGARLTTGYNFYGVTNTINLEGWGLANVPNSVPRLLPTSTAGATTPMYFLDQSPTNALATGDRQTSIVTVPSANARAQMLHITLAWTDPPGNPVAGIKLVNNLDLVVTNLGTGQVYYGNNFASASIPFSVPVNASTAPDNVNNVENVFLPAPLGTSYSVTVIGRNVAVNAVTAEQTNIVQDYALVVSCGDGANTSGISVAPAAKVSSTVPLVTYVGGSTNGVYFNQVSGANAPWLSTNALLFGTNYGFATNASLYIGQTNQWHFFVVTNTTSYSNAAFVIFDPNTLALPREGVFAGSDVNSTTPEADLDLFAASPPSDPNAASLTNLNPVVISNCVYGVDGDQASLSRGGTKFIVYSNANPGQVYYIGVQCEDQTAAQFGFIPVFSQNSFSQTDSNGNQVVYGLGLPTDIPDGDNANPGSVSILALATIPMQVASVTVTNSVTTQNSGDLVGTLTHEATDAILNNHTGLQGGFTNVYNDNGLPGTSHTDGPGSLNNFIGTQAVGPWFLTEVDDSAALNGSVTTFSLVIQPHIDLGNTGIHSFNVPPGGWIYDYVDVSAGDTNITIVATNTTTPPQLTPPVQLYLAYQAQPAVSNFLAEADLNLGTPPGNSISYGPPLAPGRYFIGLFNPGPTPQTVVVSVNLAFNASAVTTLDFDSAGPVPLVDDAVTTNSIMVNNTNFIQGFNVGLCVAHPRISDLVFTLISPAGTRYLLMENRGGQSTNGCGAEIITTNTFPPVNASGGAASQTNVFNVGQTSGKFPITYNFYSVPDEMTVYYGSNVTSAASLILDTGFTNNPGSGMNTTSEVLTVSFPPPGVQATSTYLTIVMNEFGNTNSSGDAWTYTAGGVLTNFEYLAFTEDTNLTTTPIKFAPPPFVPMALMYQTNITYQTNVTFTTNSVTLPLSGFESPTAGDYLTGTTVDGFSVVSNQVSVVNDPTNAQAGNQFLALAKGSIFTNLPTIVGSTNILTYAYRGPGITAFWRGENNYSDSINGNNGTVTTGTVPFVSAEVGNGFNYTNGPDRLSVPDAPNLDFGAGQDFSVDAWIRANSDSRGFPFVEDIVEKRFVPSPYPNYSTGQGWELCLASGQLGGQLGDTAPAGGFTTFGGGGPDLRDGKFHHVALTLVRNSTTGGKLYVDGQLVTTFDPTSQSGSLSNTQPVLIGNHPDPGVDGYFNGVIDEVSIYRRAISASEVKAIYTNLTAGKFDSATSFPTNLAKARVTLVGTPNIIFGANTNWQTNTITFVATNSATPFQIDGLEPGMLLDSLALTSFQAVTNIVTNTLVVVSNLYYLPEQSLDPLIGTSAYGEWTLEVLDDRAGATNPAPQLLSWQLEFTFANTNLPATLPLLVNGVPQTNTVAAGGISWYQVNVPTNADFATNTLLFATNLPVNLWFSTNAPPTTTNSPGDVNLLPNSTGGSSTLGTNTSSYPYIVKGGTYYLGVQNTNSLAVTFALEVNFHLFGLPPMLGAVANQYVVAGQTFTLTNTATDYNAGLLNYTLVNPPVSATISTNGVINWPTATNTPATNVLFTTVVTNAITGLGATNSFNVTVLPLLFTNAPQTNVVVAGGLNWYAVNVPTNADFATNILEFATNLPVNVLFTTNFPPTTNFATGLILNSTNATNVLSTSSSPAIVPGNTYYLGVQNTNAVSVTYALEVNFHLIGTNSLNSVTISSIVYTNIGGKFGFWLTWSAPSNYLFQVQWTALLAPATWHTFTNIISYNPNFPASATNAQFNFFDDGSQTGGFGATRFYRLINLLATNTLTLPYQGNQTFASSAPVTVTNTAIDSRTNAVLTYILTNAPSGASISSNGIITWTNATPSGIAARFTTIVTDDSVPQLTASNQFTIFVSPPPSITNVTVTATNAVLSWFAPTNDQFNVRWTTNLAPTIVWTTFPTIITSSTGLFNFTDTNAPLVMKFYQLILLP